MRGARSWSAVRRRLLHDCNKISDRIPRIWSCKISSLINIRRRIELISSPLRTVSRVEVAPKAVSHYQLERYRSHAPPRLRWNFISARSNARRIAINPWINRDQRNIRLASWRRLRFFPLRFVVFRDDLLQNHVTSSSKFRLYWVRFHRFTMESSALGSECKD